MNTQERIKKVTQCCLCKSNNETDKWVEFFNLEEGKFTIIATGCSNCRNYNQKDNKFIRPNLIKQ